MNKTIQIARGLFTLRRCNRVFTSKYCTSQKDKDPGEKNDTSSETVKRSDNPENRVSENEMTAQSLKHEGKINLCSGTEVTNSDQPAETTKFNVVDKNVEAVENVAESDTSSTLHFPIGNNYSQMKELEKLIHDVKADIDSNSGSESNVNVQSEVLIVKRDLETEKESKLGESEVRVSSSNDTFANLLRKSAFIDLGDPVNKLVTGKIYLVVDDDLYIDFGWKFPAVCRRPKVKPEIYNIGAKVLLRIKDLELTAKFLGDKEYTSLLEADCDLIHRINEDGSKFIKFDE